MKVRAASVKSCVTLSSMRNMRFHWRVNIMRTLNSEIRRQKRRLTIAETELVAAYNPKAARLFANVASELFALEAFAAIPNNDKLTRLDAFMAGFRAYRDYQEAGNVEPLQAPTR